MDSMAFGQADIGISYGVQHARFLSEVISESRGRAAEES